MPPTTGPPPVRFAFGRWTWKEVAHLLANLPMAIAGFVYTVLMTAIGV
ncbi:sensor histidine kinase, partial [Streptomyces sp. SID7803]|nr:sensor histidine kinase [Streptomyces sp. SID7803]